MGAFLADTLANICMKTSEDDLCAENEMSSGERIRKTKIC